MQLLVVEHAFAVPSQALAIIECLLHRNRFLSHAGGWRAEFVLGVWSQTTPSSFEMSLLESWMDSADPGTLAAAPESSTPAAKRRRIEDCLTGRSEGRPSGQKTVQKKCSGRAKHVTDGCDDFQMHWRLHNDKHCDKCVFARNRVRWEQATRCPHTEKTWLTPRRLDSEDWCLSCGPCEMAAAMNKTAGAAWRAARLPQFRGPTLQLQNFLRHSQSAMHRDAVNAGNEEVIDAPPLEDFEAAWAAAAGSSGEAATALNMSNRRTSSLQWCLTEAIRNAARETLRKAVAISLQLDERHGRLLVKYHACGHDLVVRVGVLALLQNVGKTAPEMAAGVHAAVRSICVRRQPNGTCNRSRCAPVASEDDNDVLAQHILNHIICYVADGDSASQLCGKMLHMKSLRSALAPKLPNLRVIIRDRAHSSRHLSARSFAADPVLQELLDVTILKPHSVIRQIRDSLPLRQIFVTEARCQAKRDDFIDIVTNMSFAGHRFDSLQKPLGRIVLNLEAIISYCHIVSRDRGPSSAEGQGCGAFLNALTEESVILLGMIADASDECMMVTRLMDREIFDVGNMWSELDAFHLRIEHLFLKGKALTTGYTKIALEYLCRPRVIEVPGKCLRSLGCKSGADETNTTRALARMANWVKVTHEISKTEFPDYDVLAKFQPFFVSDTGNTSSAKAPSDAANLSYIAKVFNVDSTKLIHQTEQHKPIAASEKRKRPTLTSIGAWSKALERTQSTSKRRQTYTADALLPMLQFFAVMTGSTSGIEQNFSSAKRNLGEQWNGSALLEESRLVLQIERQHATPPMLASVLRAARLVWRDHFGVPRVVGIARERGLGQSAAVKMRRQTESKSHAAWLRQRRSAAAALVTGLGPSPAAAAAAPTADSLSTVADTLWTDKHAAEVQWQRQVRAERELEATAFGTVLPAEEGKPELAAQNAEEQEAERRRQRALTAKHNRSAAVRAGPQLPDMRGMTVWVDPAVNDVMRNNQSSWWAPQSLRVVAQRELADIIVVQDPAQPGGRNQAAASLRGSLVCCTDFILSPPGIALKWQSALALHRVVFISDQVRATHTCMVDLVCTSHRALGRASKWQVYVGDTLWVDFQTLAAKRVSQKRTSEVRTVLHATEHGLHQYREATNVTSLQEFLESLKRLDRGSSLMGMCKR